MCEAHPTQPTQPTRDEERSHLFEALIEGARDYGIFMLDPEGYVLTWNEGAARIKGYSPKEIIGQHFSTFYTPEDVKSGRPANALRIAIAQGKFESEGWRVRCDGSQFFASILLTVLWDHGGVLRGFSKLIRDITERRQAEDRTRDSEQSLRLLADSVPEMVWTARPNGLIDYHNQRFYELTGSSPDAATDQLWNIIHLEDVRRCRDAWQSSVQSGNRYEIVCRFRDVRTDGYRWYLTRALPLLDDCGTIVKWVGTSTDIEDQKRLNRQLEQRVDERTAELRQLLAEKTTLLKEVHHRVKNNLQVICSLLSMQIDCLDGAASARPLHDAHSRVLAMSLIHEQLYRSDSFSDLNFGEYVEVLSRRLISAYSVEPARIRLDLNIEPIRFSLHRAIPCGLILNELLSNCLKHAFAGRCEGVIRISLTTAAAGFVELAVVDDGVGLPVDLSRRESRSLGLQVVRTLAHQIRADLSISSVAGTAFRLRWKLDDEEAIAAPPSSA